MRIISFSLFGDDPKYRVGMMRNAEIAPSIYPGWKVYCWCSHRIEKEVITQLEGLGVTVKIPNVRQFPSGKFWRFLAHDEPGVERFIVRDADSRLGSIERACVEEWILSGKSLHVIRDHPYHIQKVLGGTWGLVPGKIKSLASLMQPFCHRLEPDYDQRFVSTVLWSLYKDDVLQHDSCLVAHEPNCLPLPAVSGTDQWGFVGEILDENEHFNQAHRTMRARHLKLC